MARKPGTTSTTTKRGTARRKSTTAANSTGARTRSRKADEENVSDEQKASAAIATGKRQARTAQSPATNKQRSSRRQQPEVSTTKSRSAAEQPARGSKLKSVFGLPIVRNVVAASLASAAAVILYRKPKGSTAEDQSVRETSRELMPGDVGAAPATTDTATRVRRKAASAAENVTSTVKAAASKARGRRKASAEPVDAANTATTAPSLIEQPRRKLRSDAGIKRTSRKTRADVGAPSGIEPVAVDLPASLDQMETSAFAFSNEATTTAAPATNVADERLAEAHPS